MWPFKRKGQKSDTVEIPLKYLRKYPNKVKNLTTQQLIDISKKKNTESAVIVSMLPPKMRKDVTSLNKIIFEKADPKNKVHQEVVRDLLDDFGNLYRQLQPSATQKQITDRINQDKKGLEKNDPNDWDAFIQTTVPRYSFPGFVILDMYKHIKDNPQETDDTYLFHFNNAGKKDKNYYNKVIELGKLYENKEITLDQVLQKYFPDEKDSSSRNKTRRELAKETIMKKGGIKTSLHGLGKFKFTDKNGNIILHNNSSGRGDEDNPAYNEFLQRAKDMYGFEKKRTLSLRSKQQKKKPKSPNFMTPVELYHYNIDRQVKSIQKRERQQRASLKCSKITIKEDCKDPCKWEKKRVGKCIFDPKKVKKKRRLFF